MFCCWRDPGDALRDEKKAQARERIKKKKLKVKEAKAKKKELDNPPTLVEVTDDEVEWKDYVV